MTRVRYLNKSFLTLTQNKLHYMPGLKKKAVLKVSLHEVYQGQERMPMLNHPYYTYCTELKVIYQLRRDEEHGSMHNDYESMLMQDLFTVKNLFPNMIKLKLIVSHSHT